MGATSRSRRAISLAVCGALVAGTTTACFAESSAMPAVRDFLIAWEVQNYEAAARRTVGADTRTVAAALSGVRDQLDAASMKLALGVSAGVGEDQKDVIVRDGDEATARFSVTIDLGENGEPFTYPGQLKLRRTNGRWKVVWSPSLIHPNLSDGQRLAVVTEVPARGDVEDQRGQSLLRKVETELVGVYPGRLRDPQKTISQLVEATEDGGRKLDAERLLGRVRSAPPTTFLPLVTLNSRENAAVLNRLRRIDGLQFQQRTQSIEPDVAPELIGGLGPATDDRLQRVGAPYQPGDTIGVSGFQLLQQRYLAGTPTVKVVALDPNGQHTEVLAEWRGLPAQNLRTSLDSRLQRKAQEALDGLPYPASMAVIRPSSGEVLAVANHRTAGRNLAMEGRYPPGLTFGIVSAGAMLHSGMTASDETECPADTAVGGRRFTHTGKVPAQKTFQWTFGFSCATTLAQLSTRVSGPALLAEAGVFGFGKDWGLSVPAFTGSVPMPADDGAKAALATGQGVLASPLGMALAAGAVGSGTWRPPLLLKAPQEAKRVQAVPLPPEISGADGLKTLMQRAVHSGTARPAYVPGGATPVHGVVAQAEYTENGRTKTVSWFVGWRGEHAFAIAVEGKVSAGEIAHRFLVD